MPLEIKWMVPFIDTPTIIVTFTNEMSRLPQILSVVSHPNMPRLLVDTHFPWIAESNGPEFRASLWNV